MTNSNMHRLYIWPSPSPVMGDPLHKVKLVVTCNFRYADCDMRLVICWLWYADCDMRQCTWFCFRCWQVKNPVPACQSWNNNGMRNETTKVCFYSGIKICSAERITYRGIGMEGQNLIILIVFLDAIASLAPSESVRWLVTLWDCPSVGHPYTQSIRQLYKHTH